MISSSLRWVALAGAALGLAASLPAAEPPIIAKARARLGSEAALDALRSVHYIGTLVSTDPKDATKQTRAEVEMFFQKPDQQCITATYDKFVETTALDAYEGWTRLQDSKDPTKWRLTLLNGDQVKRLRANTWEALAYFRGIERVGGHLEDKGPATIEGVACEKVAFIHDPQIIFYHYFELATGRVVLTETENGSTVRQTGEMIVNGIRFPASFSTTTKNGDKSQTVTVNYKKIMVNEALPAGQFRVPALPRK